MYIHLENKIKFWCLLIVLTLSINNYISAKIYPIKINLTVMPPYTSSLADYIHTPNKIVATINNMGLNQTDADIYLSGSIKSDGGIVIQTSKSFKPSSSIHIPAGMTYSLTSEDISNMFDVNMLDVQGINLADLMSGAGLPEDNYQICIRAYDFFTGLPVSDEDPLGCSNYFMITNLESPIITNPFCGDSVSIQPFQNIMISWTIPAGALGAQYKFEMVEISESMHINPNHAFQSSAFPPFYEEITSSNILNLTSAKVMLTEGFTYAFRIQAFDPFNRYNFRNLGYSEICYFVCKENSLFEFSEQKSDKNISNTLDDFEKQFKLIPSTVINGRLLAKFPDNPNDAITLPMPNSEPIVYNPKNANKYIDIPSSSNNTTAQNNNGVSYKEVSNITSAIKSNINSNNITIGSSDIVSSYNASTNTIQMLPKEPYYYFGQTEKLTNTKPLGNMQIRLVARLATGTYGAVAGLATPSYSFGSIADIGEVSDVNGITRIGKDVVNVVLATTTTDEYGNFTFNFTTDFFTGNTTVMEFEEGSGHIETHQENPRDKLGWGMEDLFPGTNFSANIIDQQLLGTGGQQSSTQHQTMSFNPGEVNYIPSYLCLKIEVVHDKFCSPDIDIFAMPGDNMELPTQVAKLKTYNLKVVVKASDDKNQTAIANEPMDNVKVQILRNMQNINDELDIIIDYEGQRLKTETHNNNGIFKDIAIDTTGAGNSAYAYFTNLVKHAYIKPQYFMDISTRNTSNIENEYEFTRYNYETIFKELPTTNDNNAEVSSYIGISRAVYNREYTIPEIELINYMKPLRPEIKGRIMAKTNFQNTHIENVRIELYNQDEYEQTFTSAEQFYGNTYAGSVHKESEELTNDVGIFRFENLELKRNDKEDIVGPFRRILITHPSYKRVIRPIPGFKPWNLSWGMLKDIKDINLELADSILGYVSDEDGNPVSAFIKTQYSPFYNTQPNIFFGKTYQFFTLPAQHHHNVIIVHPKSSQYFKRDTTINILPNKRFKIVVYKKLHRPKIVVTNESGTPIQNVTIELGEQTPDTTDNMGIVKFKYASPDNQIIIRISPPNNYAPIQEPINIPVTASDTVFKYVLEYAKSIKGTITEKGNNTYISDAIIYAELENTDGTILYIETTSNQQGKYILSGIPSNTKSLEVFVVKKGDSPSYIGDSKTITFSESITLMSVIPSHNFELKRMDDWDLSSIWGYPVAVNGFRTVKNKTDEYLVDGYFYDPPLTGGFSLQQPDVKLDFKYIRIKKSSDGKIEPVESKIELDVNKIPVFINQTFSGILYNQKQITDGYFQLNTYGSHEIFKEKNVAKLQGILQLNVSSFNFAYDFHGTLYAGSSKLKNKVEVFSKVLSSDLILQPSGIISQQQPQYTILPRFNIFSLSNSFQPVPINNYKVFGFPATSRNEGSYLNGDKIYIQTVLHTDIPRCETCSNLDLNIHAGNIIITKTDINLVEFPSDTLNFQLEKWKVYNKGNWHFDKNEEAIVLEKALIVTGKSINATVLNLKIRPTSLGESDVDLTDGGLSLGGIAKIKLNGNLKPVFNYDPIGHYRISLLGSIDMGIPAGTVEQLPAMKHGERIELESIGLLSNGTDILSINKKFRFYDILDLEVSQIISGNGYFDLQGTPELGIPNLIPQETAMRYMLNSQGKITPQLQPIKGGIDTKGYVYFSFDQTKEAHSIKNKEYKGYGTIYINNGTNINNKTFTLRAQLIKHPNECKIEIFPVDQDKLYRGKIPQNMIVGKNKILVTEGLINASSNQWDKLVYSGNTQTIEGLNKSSKENKLKFTVDGAIDVSSSDIQVTNIDVGIGKLKMVYNFDDASMKGTLAIANVPLGPAFVNKGEMTVSFNNDGFYFVVASESLIIGTAGEFKGGFILGSTSKVAPEDISCIADNFKVDLPKFTTQGLKGMYVIGEKVILNKTIDLIFLEASASVGMGLYVNTNFSDNPTFLIGGYGHAMLKGSNGFEELGVTVCDVGVCLSAYFNIEAGYEDGNLIMNNCASISAVGYSSGLCTAPFQAIGVDPSLRYSISAKYGYDKDFYFNLDLSGSCLSGTNSNNSDVCGK